MCFLLFLINGCQTQEFRYPTSHILGLSVALGTGSEDQLSGEVLLINQLCLFPLYHFSHSAKQSN